LSYVGLLLIFSTELYDQSDLSLNLDEQKTTQS